MAEKRMFTRCIIDSDLFLDLPPAAQALYFHLNMRADDDGFVNNPKKIQRMVGASDEELRQLVEKQFVLAFDSGILAIKHWYVHNYIRKDTYRETLYLEEKSALFVKPDGSYTDQPLADLPPEELQPVDEPLTQNRLDQIRLDQISLDKNRSDQSGLEKKGEKALRFVPPSLEEVCAYCAQRGKLVDPQHFLDFYEAKGWMIGKNRMKDWKAAIRSWEQRGEQSPSPRKQTMQQTAAAYRPPSGPDDAELMRKLLNKQRNGG